MYVQHHPWKYLVVSAFGAPARLGKGDTPEMTCLNMIHVVSQTHPLGFSSYCTSLVVAGFSLGQRAHTLRHLSRVSCSTVPRSLLRAMMSVSSTLNTLRTFRSNEKLRTPIAHKCRFTVRSDFFPPIFRPAPLFRGEGQREHLRNRQAVALFTKPCCPFSPNPGTNPRQKTRQIYHGSGLTLETLSSRLPPSLFTCPPYPRANVPRAYGCRFDPRPSTDNTNIRRQTVTSDVLKCIYSAAAAACSIMEVLGYPSLHAVHTAGVGCRSKLKQGWCWLHIHTRCDQRCRQKRPLFF